MMPKEDAGTAAGVGFWDRKRCDLGSGVPCACIFTGRSVGKTCICTVDEADCEKPPPPWLMMHHEQLLQLNAPAIDSFLRSPGMATAVLSQRISDPMLLMALNEHPDLRNTFEG